MASAQNLVPIQPVWSMHCQFDAVNFCQFMTMQPWRARRSGKGLSQSPGSAGGQQAPARARPRVALRIARNLRTGRMHECRQLL